MFQPLQRAKLNAKVEFIGTRMVGFLRQQLGTVGELVAPCGRVIGDGLRLFLCFEGPGLIKGQIVGPDPTWRGALGNAIPTIKTARCRSAILLITTANGDGLRHRGSG